MLAGEGAAEWCKRLFGWWRAERGRDMLDGVKHDVTWFLAWLFPVRVI